nr:DUF2953 domain-containing protein [Paenibacillus hamazuiensis]
MEQGGTGFAGKGEEHVTAEKIKQAFRNLKELVRYTFQLNEWLKGVLAHVKCTKLRWETRLGVGDAADTAVTTGVVWGLKSSLLGFVFQYLQLRTKPQIAVIPQFNETHFSTNALWVAKIRMWHAACAGVMLLYRIMKVKGGPQKWQHILFKA